MKTYAWTKTFTKIFIASLPQSKKLKYHQLMNENIHTMEYVQSWKEWSIGTCYKTDEPRKHYTNKINPQRLYIVWFPLHGILKMREFIGKRFYLALSGAGIQSLLMDVEFLLLIMQMV